jgi:hypothetical protein
MSVDHCAISLIGCRLEKDKFSSTKMVRGCNHDLPEGANFCPKCGEKSFSMEAYSLLKDVDFNKKLESSGICVMFQDSDFGSKFFVGLKKFVTSEVDIIGIDYSRAESSDFASAKEETREALEKMGMWDEKNFAIWTVGYCC